MKIFFRCHFWPFLPLFFISVSVTRVCCKNVPFLNHDYEDYSKFDLNLSQNHEENDDEPELQPVPVPASSHWRTKQRRQVFREDLSPKLGGKIPSGALEWTRLMFNNMDSRGISVPDGWIPSTNDRVSSDESRIRYFRDEMSVPNIETTYSFPISLSMIRGLDTGAGDGDGTDSSAKNTGSGSISFSGYGDGTGIRYPPPPPQDKSVEEKRKSNVMFSNEEIGDWENTRKKTKKIKKVSDNVLHMELKPFNSGSAVPESDRNRNRERERDRDRDGRSQHQTRQRHYQKVPNKVELHFFSPNDMEKLETTYRDQIIDDIISRLKSSTGTSTSSSSSSQNKRTGGKNNKNGGQPRLRTPSLLSTTFSRMTKGNGRL